MGYFHENITSRDDIFKQDSVPLFQDLNPPFNNEKIGSINELKHCYTNMQSLLKKAKTYHMTKVRSMEAENVLLTVDEIDASLEILKNTSFIEN